MRSGLLIIFIALLVILALYLGKGTKADPVSRGVAGLDKAKWATLEPIMRQVQAAVSAYADETGGYPEDLEELVPRFLPRPDLLIDPWGTGLRLELDAQQKLSLLSAGPDRLFATRDDSRRSL